MRCCNFFQWKINDITKRLQKVKDQGFDSILINSVQPFKQQYDDNPPWWCCFQPLAYKIGNRYGSKEDLINLCNEAKKYNIKILVDIVITHVANDNYGNIIPHSDVDRELIEADIWKSFKPINDWNSRWEVTNLSHGLPTINFSKPKAQELALKFINELKDCGVLGLRIDSCKSIALPEEGCDFLTKLPKDLEYWGEVIFEPKELIDGYCKYINVLTSSYGSDKNKLMTYIDNWDLDKTFHITSHYTNEVIKREYDILCGNFPNTLFYVRPFDNCWESEEVKRANLR